MWRGSFNWAEHEMVVAADLAWTNEWRILPPGRPELAEVSALLRGSNFHPVEGRRAKFRSPGSVRFKVANLVSAHPAYHATGVRVTSAERAVVQAFTAAPEVLHNLAYQIRAAIRAQIAGEDSTPLEMLQISLVLQGPIAPLPSGPTLSTSILSSADSVAKREAGEGFRAGSIEPATREQRMIAMRFEGATLDAIGMEFGVTRERVRQIIRDSNGPSSSELKSALAARERRQVEARRLRIQEALRALVFQSGAITAAEASDRINFEESEIRQHWPDDIRQFRLRESAPVEQLWSDADIMAALRAAAVYDFPLSAAAYTELVRMGEVSGPSLPLVYQRFGGWLAACESAGVVHGKAMRHYESRWSDDELLVYARDYFLAPDWPESAHRYDEWRLANAPDGPSQQTLRNRLGRWSEIKRRALAPKEAR
jgi:hypothetical protein